MKIHRCDRCGKVIEHHDRNKVEIKEWDNARDKIDLCNDCLAEFYKFIYSEEKKNDMAQESND